jgi:hypothetical protein
MSGLSYAAAHVNAASKAGQNVQGLHSEIQLLSTELIRALNLLLASMQAGDPNITTVQNQITALS